MAFSRAQQVKELIPGLHALFGMDYKRYGDQWRDIFSINKSNRSFEEEVKLYGLAPAGTKTEGAGVRFDQGGEAWITRYTHETIAMAFAITEEAVEDNLYESVSQRYVKSMARSMAYTKNVKGAAVLNNGFSGSYPIGDGQAFFSTAHPLKNGSTFANRPSVDVDLNETSLEATLIAISKWIDDRGMLVACRAKKLVLPPDLDFVATRLLQTQLRSSVVATGSPTASYAPNDVNAIYTKSSIPGGYSINNFLTNPKAWFLITDVQDGDGMKYFERVKLTTKDDVDFTTGNVMFKARERYSFGVSDPMCAYASSGS